MLSFVLLAIGWIIYKDTLIFKKQDLELFVRTFRIPHRLLLCFLAVAALLFIASKDRGDVLPAVTIIFVLPLYLLRRHRFVKALSLTQPAVTPASSTILISDAYGVILKWFCCLMVSNVVVRLLFYNQSRETSELAELLISAMFSFLFMIFFISRASRKFSPNGFFYNMGLHRGNRPFLIRVGMPVILGICFAVLSTAIISVREIQPETPLGKILEATKSSAALQLFLLVAVLVAPFAEEIIFRGYFFHVIREYKGERFAVYVIASIFALMHVGQYWGDWAAIGMVAILGFALTGIRALTGTTTSSVIMHYVYNAGVTFLALLAGKPPT